MEEPEDMTIYSMCVSKYYGILTGNDRFSLVRYWDRRKNKIIQVFINYRINSAIINLLIEFFILRPLKHQEIIARFIL